MRRIWKYVGIAALVAVLGLGTVATVAWAQGATGSIQGPFNYYERFRQALAGILGISVDQYDSAVAQAQEQTLNDLVAEGWLTQDQADQMRQRLEKSPDGMFGAGLDRGFGHGRGGWAVNLFAVAAEKLGLDEADLHAALGDGQTIAGLAQEKGVDPQTIVDACMAELKTRLDQAVADGRMTQKMADWTIEQARTQVAEQLTTTWQDKVPPADRAPLVSLRDVAAEQLGMNAADLQAALDEGKTIAGLAQEKGIDPQTIIDAYIAQLAGRLNEAVAAGTMTQAQVDKRLEQARTQAAEQIQGAWQFWGPHRGPGGRGPGGFLPAGPFGDQW